jgi:predicted dehydrogenase
MKRRHFLAIGLASSLSIAARAAEGRLRVAVIGHTGRGNFGHGLDTMWLGIPETEVVAVADADAAGLVAAQRKLRGAKAFAGYHAMLDETRPDLVAVAPRYLDEHRDMILAAIAAGARGIYVEKPFCRSPAEADEIATACAKQNVKLAIAHRNRYHPAVPVVASLVADGVIGRLLELRGRGKEDERGGALDLWVLGSHVLNMADYFGEGPVACSATVLEDGRPVTRSDVKDGAEGTGPLAGNEVHARFEMKRGIPAFFDSTQKAGVAAAGFGLQLIGTKGIINFRADKEPVAYLLPGNPFQPDPAPRSWTPITSAGIGKPEPVADLARLASQHILAGRDLIAAIREDRPPLCDVGNGRTIVEMIASVFESHRLGGQRVTFPLKNRENPFTLL